MQMRWGWMADKVSSSAKDGMQDKYQDRYKESRT
jgi:hypothetical protein